MARFDARRARRSNYRFNLFGEDKQKISPLMIFPFIENKLNIINLSKKFNPTAIILRDTT